MNVHSRTSDTPPKIFKPDADSLDELPSKRVREMSSDRTKTAFELVGVIAVVASLIFLGIEVRQAGTEMTQAREVALREIDMSALETKVQWRALMAEYADVWVRGNAGELLPQTDSIIFRQLVVGRNDIAYFDSQRMAELGQPELAETVRRDFSGFLHRNPGARVTFLARSEEISRVRNRLAVGQGDEPLFATGWRDAVLEDLAVLDEDR